MNSKLLISIILLMGAAHAQATPSLAAAPARSTGTSAMFSTDGVVEAVRQTVLAAQVAGAIVELRVKAGDRVKAGQVLVRIDARAAVQSASASEAQAQSARASLEVAARDFDRQKLLSQKGFISQAALDQAEAVYKAAAAQVNAQLAQAGAARTQSDFFILRAPYDGLAADVPVVLGDMALPGRALVTIYDPATLRVTVSIPQTATLSASTWQSAKVELPGAATSWIVPSSVTLLPTADPATHTLQLRLVFRFQEIRDSSCRKLAERVIRRGEHRKRPRAFERVHQAGSLDGSHQGLESARRHSRVNNVIHLHISC